MFALGDVVGEFTFFLSVAIAHSMTNLDNLALMLVLAPLVGVRRCLTVYLATQTFCIAFSGVTGITAIGLLGEWVGVLGFIPIGLGFYALWKRVQGNAASYAAPPSSLGATIVLFGSLGVDTAVVMSAILGDSTQTWRGLAYLGAGASLAGLTALFLFMVNGRVAKGAVEKTNQFAPFAMIAVGLYILSDSASDAR